MKKTIFATHSNLKLTQAIAKKAGYAMGRADIKKFVDQEIYVHIKEDVKHKHVYVCGSTFPPADNVLELLILIHALKVNKAKKISFIIPYFAYAKSDHIDPPGMPLTAKLMVDMLEHAGVDETIAINLHSPRVEQFFTKKLTHLSAIPRLVDYFKHKHIANLAVASPDKGGISRAKEFARELDIKNIIAIKKYRPAFDKAKIIEISGDVMGKNVIIVDDMIQSGGTILKATRALKKQGAKDIYVAVTHLVFSGSSVPLLEQEPSIKQIIFTNTISTTEKLPTKFKQLSVVDLIVDAIK